MKSFTPTIPKLNMIRTVTTSRLKIVGIETMRALTERDRFSLREISFSGLKSLITLMIFTTSNDSDSVDYRMMDITEDTTIIRSITL